LVDPIARGYANRQQGFYGECVFQAIAAAANLKISRQSLDPDCIDFEIIQERSDRLPRCKRIEIQVKTKSNFPRSTTGTLPLSLRRKSYHALNGRVGQELDIPRYLVLITVPHHFSSYCNLSPTHVKLANLAYWHNLMCQPNLPFGQESVTVSVPERNLLTPEALVALTCGDREEAAQWMSA
jgi:hypothetical protein